MKNVGFINPPSEFLINQRVFVTLGILRVVTYLNTLNICKVKFLDLSNETDYYNSITEFIKKNDLQVVCFTATTPQIQVVYQFCKFINSNFKIKIILGGPHITLMHSSLNKGTDDIRGLCFKHIYELMKWVDTIVVGDGEYAIVDALTSDKKLINSECDSKLFLKRNYDEVAIPDRQFLDLSSYSYTIDGVKATNIISQMGCPYQCMFCSGRGSKTFNTVRKRSVKNIIEEIDNLYTKYDYRGFMFYDDELNVNKYYFMEFLEELILYQYLNNVHFKLRGFTRADLLTAEQASKMYQAGFRWILTGFESGSDRMLINMNKGNTVKDNTNALEMARQAGLKVKALMSIWHPGESLDTINETKDWLLKVRPDETDITIISTYPGTPYYDETIWNEEKNAWQYINKKTGDKLYSLNVDYMKDSVFYKSDPNSYKAFVFTDYLNCQELVDERKKLDFLIKGMNNV